MPSRRELIQMSAEEIRAYLRTQPRLIVTSNGPSGFPHPVPMNFALDDQDRIYITTFRKSQKVKNFERDPRAALLVESGALYAELKSVIVYANADIIDEPATIRETARGLHWTLASSPTAQARASVAEQIDDSFAKRVIIRFTPQKYVSWDHNKLRGAY